MTFMEVYNSLDFQRYCQKLTAEWTDLANDTAVVVLSLPTEKRTQIEKGGYMLRYAQRVALRIWGGGFRKQLDLDEYRSRIVAQSLRGYDATQVVSLIKQHINNPLYSIQAKMLLYAVEYGGARKLASKMGVPPRTVQRIIKEYIACLKSQL
jgi:hypothetical protein